MRDRSDECIHEPALPGAQGHPAVPESSASHRARTGSSPRTGGDVRARSGVFQPTARGSAEWLCATAHGRRRRPSDEKSLITPTLGARPRRAPRHPRSVLSRTPRTPAIGGVDRTDGVHAGSAAGDRFPPARDHRRRRLQWLRRELHDGSGTCGGADGDHRQRAGLGPRGCVLATSPNDQRADFHDGTRWSVADRRLALPAAQGGEQADLGGVDDARRRGVVGGAATDTAACVAHGACPGHGIDVGRVDRAGAVVGVPRLQGFHDRRAGRAPRLDATLGPFAWNASLPGGGRRLYVLRGHSRSGRHQCQSARPAAAARATRSRQHLRPGQLDRRRAAIGKLLDPARRDTRRDRCRRVRAFTEQQEPLGAQAAGGAEPGACRRAAERGPSADAVER